MALCPLKKSNIHYDKKIFLKLILFLLFNFVIIFSNNSVASIKTNFVPTTQKNFSLFNNIVSEIINDCYKGFGKILIIEGFYDQSYSPLIFPVTKTEITKLVIDIRTVKRFEKPQKDFDNTDAIFIFTDLFNMLPVIFKVIYHINVFHNKRPMFIFVSENKTVLPPLENFFWTNWSVLTFYYMFEVEDTIVVFTGNPYSLYAPEPWQLARTGSMNIFGRDYVEGELCQGFVFDRTKYLNQTELRFMSSTQAADGVYPKEIQDFCTGHWRPTLSIFEKALKVKTKLYCYNSSGTWQHVSTIFKSFKPHVSFIQRPMRGYTASYPPAYMPMTILSHNQGYRTLFEEMYSLFGKWITLYTGVLLLITFFVCFYAAKTDKIAFAIFDIIRLLTATSIRTNINRLVLRIFFFTIIFYFLLMQSIFQGKLANFLTNPRPHKNADTLEDLESSMYKKIFYSSDNGVLQTNLNVAKKCLRYQQLWMFLSEFKENKSVALVDNLGVIGWVITHYSYEIYIAQSPISNKPYPYSLERGNPLNELINNVLLLHYEVGFTRLLEREANAQYWNVIGRLKSIALVKGVNKPIDLKSIMCLLILLAVGWVTATITFIGEIIVYRSQNSKSLRVEKATERASQPSNTNHITENRNDDDCIAEIR